MRLDGLDEREVAALAGAPVAWVLDAVTSTMDEAHRRAEAGAPSGALVIANSQHAGRGRHGRAWTSEPGGGLWMTSIHREVDAVALDCLTIRVGLALAACLDPLADGPVGLKWPNDVFVGRGKVSGVLTEARWRSSELQWVAVGVGINIVAPAAQSGASGLRQGVARRDLLATVPAAVRAACAARGELSAAEIRAFAARDVAAGSTITSPAVGVACGIAPNGALVVETATGRQLCRTGSLVRRSEA